jgi:hypothetical protein
VGWGEGWERGWGWDTVDLTRAGGGGPLGFVCLFKVIFGVFHSNQKDFAES